MAYTTIDNPELHFQTKLYTANQTDGTAITLDGSEDMSPNMCWWKNRDATYDHRIIDTVRGVTKILTPNTTAAEATNSDALASFDSDGFTVNADPAGYGLNYANTNKIVAWCWKGGTSSGSSNSNGSISSTVSVNTTAGFSIVKYTGTGSNATVGHGLGAVPQMTIIKGTGNTYNWGIYHHKLGNQKNLNLNSNSAANNDSSGVYYNSTTPTSTVFSIGTNVGYNASSADYIAYCFVEKQGYSKFGSYTGNGNADGTYVHLGFRPAWIMIKRSDSSGNWFIHDNKRVTFNVDNKYLAANDAAAEQTFTALDMLSNGFKLRTSGTGYNASSGTFTYYAFAESPFVNSSGVPNNAR